ncbi:4334_t:CDS:2 [Paraglomus brasilianum]|uniref:4334_t:CDS:1 n=1 Tax=Paraglomus brasilianum TaxID=144538 RepID=A0A9N9CZS2_9GLOM|nr:4334_t:CDS:2 [Paraglomus brasilianum]
MPPHKESSLLTSFFLDNELQDSLTLLQFTNSFPAAHRDNPQIKKLYKELQASRREIRSIVKKNIEEECERASYPRSNNNGDAENSEYEQMDVDYDGSSGEEVDSEALDAFDDDDEKHRRLTLDQAIETLANAETILTTDINRMEQECGEWLKTFEALNEEMSDLIYGRVTKDSVSGLKVIADLRELIYYCERTAPGSRKRKSKS